METEDFVIELEPFKAFYYLQYVGQRRSKEHVDILVVLVSADNFNYVIDLFLMDEIKLSHFKRILLSN